MTIPHIIHQIWWQGDSNIPNEMIEWRKGWKKNHSTYTFILWDKDTFEKLLYRLQHPFYNTIYADLSLMIQKIDFCKYIVLYHYGGVYVDMDTISEQPLDELLPLSDLTVSKLTIYKYLNIQLINNGVLLATRGHLFFNYLLLEIYYNRRKKRYQTTDLYIMESTGPIAFTRAIIQYIECTPNINNKNIRILHPAYFESYTLDNIGNSKGLYITHIHNISWASSLFKLHFHITKYYPIVFYGVFVVFLYRYLSNLI